MQKEGIKAVPTVNLAESTTSGVLAGEVAETCDVARSPSGTLERKSWRSIKDVVSRQIGGSSGRKSNLGSGEKIVAME